MGLRKDFLVHKRKTVESFRFVKADVSSLNANVENIKNMLVHADSRISALETEAYNLKSLIDKCLYNIDAQNSNSLNIVSKIENAGKSLGNLVETISSFKNKIW